MKKYYIAYGSNLNVSQMSYRCPEAKVVGSAMLNDYELTFKYFLTIEKKKGCHTPIGVWEITSGDEKYLDMYEGYPSHYHKEYIDIEVDGKVVQGLIYIMNNIREVQPPSEVYMQTCTIGYNDFGLDLNYLTDAMFRSITGGKVKCHF